MNTNTHQLLHKLLDAALLSPHHVFFNFAPHVNCIHVYAFKGGWNPPTPAPDFNRHVYLTDGDADAQLEQTLEKIKSL